MLFVLRSPSILKEENVHISICKALKCLSIRHHVADTETASIKIIKLSVDNAALLGLAGSSDNSETIMLVSNQNMYCNSSV